MITRAQVLERHSPTAWGLIAIAAAAATEVVLVIGWNAWEYRDQLLDSGIRAIQHLRGGT